MARLVGTKSQVNSDKKVKTCPIVTLPTKNPRPKTKKQLNLNKMTCRIRREFEQLSIYSSWRVMARNFWATVVVRANFEG